MENLIVTTPQQLKATLLELLGMDKKQKAGYMTIKQVCEYLQMGETAVRELVAAGQLKKYRAGRSRNSAVRYKISEVDELFDQLKS